MRRISCLWEGERTKESGVGKTTLAEHLVQRLVASGKHGGKGFEVFSFNVKKKQKDAENETQASVEDWMKIVLDFIRSKGRHDLIDPLGKMDEPAQKVQYLLVVTGQLCTPIFIFDNMESFLELESEQFRQEHAELARALQILMQGGDFHLIITSRYPFSGKGFERIEPVNLNHVSLNDFWKKCHHLKLEFITDHFSSKKANARLLEKEHFGFSDLVQYLHSTFGGNYRALEFFASKIKEDKSGIEKALETLVTFREKYKDAELEVKQKMSIDLFFNELTTLLSPAQALILHQLAQYNISVTALAIERQQNPGMDAAAQQSGMDRLHRLTLIEKNAHPITQLPYYYVTPLTRELLMSNPPPVLSPAFSHSAAGHYHLYAFHNLGNDLSDHEEAFGHFLKAANREKVGELGLKLTNLYYDNSFYRRAFYFAFSSFQLLKEATPPYLLNQLGLIYDMFGQYDQALPVYLLAQKKFEKEGDKAGKSSILNNIGQLYLGRGDYQEALKYLEHALEIRYEISDKKGMGVTINNISKIFKAKGDYQSALDYLEKSLKIQQEAGDKKGEGASLNGLATTAIAKGDYEIAQDYLLKTLKITKEISDRHGEGSALNNLASIAFFRGDYETALEYFQKSLRIMQEIGDKKGESAALCNISNIYKAQSNYKNAMEYSFQDLKIVKEIGDKAGEGNSLNNLAVLFLEKSDYVTSLSFFEKSLKIRQEIGDRAGEGVTLSNIGQNYKAGGDYQAALEYFEKSLKISQEIGDKGGECATLNNISQIFDARGDYQTALEYLNKSLKITKEIANKAGEAIILNNISCANQKIGNYQTALECLEVALDIQKKIGDKVGESATLNNISQIYAAQGNYKIELEYLEACIKIRQETGDNVGMAITLHNMAHIFLKQKDFKKYLKIHAQAWQLAMETKDAMGLFQVGQSLGENLCRFGDTKNGLEILKIAYTIGQQSGLPGTEEIGKIIAHFENNSSQ